MPYLSGEVEKINIKYGKLVAYGASARSSTILNFAKIGKNHLKFIVDKNPLKNNLYTPGTKIKIINSKFFFKKINQFKIILILAWNFKKEIIKEIQSHGFSGRIILPLPKKISNKFL